MTNPELPSTSTSTSRSFLWARLISQDPVKKDILLPTKPNEPQSFEMKNKWKIYQSLDISRVFLSLVQASTSLET